MSRSWGNWAAALAALALTITLSGTAAHAAPDSGCDEMLAGTTSGQVEVQSQPPPGSEVLPGEVVEVVLTWDPAHFQRVDRITDCLTVDGRRSEGGGLDLARAENSGRHQHRFTVPEDAPAGSAVCNQAVVAGSTPDGGSMAERSQPACLMVARVVATADGKAPREAVTEAQSRRKPDSPSTTTTQAPTTTTTEAPTTTTTTEPTTPTTVVAQSAPPEEIPRRAAEAQPADVVYEAEPAPAALHGPPSLPRTGPAGRLLTWAGAAITLGGVAVVGSAACQRRRRGVTRR